MAHETSTTTHTTSKRKRGNLDHDNPRPAPSYTRSTVGASNEASGDMQPYEVDDSAISQLIAHNQDAHPNGGNAASASDTAAAALSHYQMGGGGDASFQTQGSAADASFGIGDSGYTLDQLKDSTSQGQGPTSQQSPTGATSAKPPVGSDEWHKVRRDNHKEGIFLSFCFIKVSETNVSIQSSVAVAKLSTKASTSSRRSFLVARRTRAPSSSALSNTSLNLRITRVRILKSGRWKSFSLTRQSTN
jgi:hypothetical protein